MNVLKQIIWTCLIPCFFSILLVGNASAQPTECFDFDNLEVGTQYGKDSGLGPNEPFKFIESDAITTLVPFEYQSGIEPGFWNLSVVDWDLGEWGGSEQYLFFGNLSLAIDFTTLPDVVSLVSFNFKDGGGEHNIQVNGGELYNVYEFKELPKAIGPDVELTIDGDLLILSGDIRNLIIGGQELGLDNFCYVVNDVPPQCVSNVEVAIQCTPNEIFYADIKFDAYNPPSDSFFIRGNGQNYGKFAYGQESYQVGPIEPIPNLEYEFVIVDAIDENCTNAEFVGKVDCTVEPPCKMENLWVEIGECDTNGKLELYFGFDRESVNPEGFKVYIDDDFITFLNYDELADSIGYRLANLSLSPGEHVLKICNEEEQLCCASKVFETSLCENLCKISNLSVEVSNCQADKSYYLTLKFNHENANPAGFDAYIDDQFIRFLPADAGEGYTFEKLFFTGPHTFTICGNDNENCCQTVTFEGPSCASECRIFDFVASAYQCEENGLYDVTFDFEPEALTGTTFDAKIGEVTYEALRYAELPITIENVELEEEEINRVEVCVFQSTSELTTDVFKCCARVRIDKFDCPDENECILSNLEKEHIECRPDGKYYLEFRFDHSIAINVADLRVFINEENYDFTNSFGIYKVDEVVASEGGNNQLTLCYKKDGIDCCIEVDFFAPDCSDIQNCEIKNLVAETSNCQEGGTFFLEFSAETFSKEDSIIRVYINEEFYDFFPIQDEYRIDQLTLPEGEHILTICTAVNDLCCEEIVFQAPSCDPTMECDIHNVLAEAHPCQPDGSFLVDIEFEVMNPTAARFKIYGNGKDYGSFEYGEIFYTIGPIFPEEVELLEFIVEDIENVECQGVGTLPLPICETNNDCLLGNLSSEVSNCFPDGTVDIQIAFEVEQADNNQGFNVYLDEEYVETYGFHQNPFSLTKVNLSAGEHKLSICRNDIDNCCISKSILIPDCGVCKITNVTANATDCTDEDYFFVELAFDIEHPSADRFRVVGNSQLYGVFAYGEASYTLGPLDGDGETEYEFIVQDLENETCASFAELTKTIDCEESFVWPGDANFDNITDNTDLLNIGLAFGKSGPERSVDIINATTWEGQEAEDWDFTFKNGLNFKHADCNGDGIVNELDKEAIESNYLFTHGTPLEKTYSPNSQNAPSLLVDFPSLTDIEVGKETKLPIIFGNENRVAEAYGLAFTLKFDPTLLKEGTVVFTESWMGTPDEDLLIINKNMEEGLIELALTRKDGINPIGAGLIGNFIVIIDNIEGYTGEGKIEIQKVQAVDNEGNLLAVHTPQTQVSSLTDINDLVENEESQLTIYPNPAGEYVAINSKMDQAIKQVEILTISGALVKQIDLNELSNIDITDLTQGVYMLSIKTSTHQFYQKLVKQ